MTKKPRTRSHRYHLRNWSEYNRALKARGSLTLWMDQSAIDNWIRKPNPGEKLLPGHPVTYTDLAIRCMLTLKAVFHLSLRSTQGFASSLIELMQLAGKFSGELPTPDHTTISRRGRKIHVDLGVHHHGKEPLHLLVDSTGLKLSGEGEWTVNKYGPVKQGKHRKQGKQGKQGKRGNRRKHREQGKERKQRKWLKLHLLVDGKALLIRDVATSDQHASDSKEFVKLLHEETDAVATVKGDGAYDTHAAYDAVRARPEHPVAIFPPRRARRGGTKPRPDRGHPRAEGQRVNPGGYRHHIWQHGNSKAPPLDRDRHVRRIREVGRKRWKEEVGYHERSLVETEIFRFEHIFGSSLSARGDATRQTEVRIKAAALNRMTELGMPDSYLVQAA